MKLRHTHWRTVGREGLTARQREVAQLLAESHPVKEVALILRITAKTVEYHRKEICRRLGMPQMNSASLAIITRWAVANHVIDIDAINTEA